MMYTHAQLSSASPKLERVTQQNQIRSPLLRLPAELRNRIYEFTFLGTGVKIQSLVPRSRNPRWMRQNLISNLESQSAWRTALSLLGSCRQIHHEALSISYEACMFDVDSVTSSTQYVLYTYVRLVQKLLISQKSLRYFSTIVGRSRNILWCISSVTRVKVRCHDFAKLDAAKLKYEISHVFDGPDLVVEFQDMKGRVAQYVRKSSDDGIKLRTIIEAVASKRNR
ncbi:hypothetical protein CC86DRAFT_400176 [Ophiobolus disseminans]|uniref:DUF7730 domain-containing protein n=1 Tax=Ophiobolus disseminans TaxID=1469910 RepID=A0A6A7AJS5_9PLEO|nr:hypothetical protein CC86DRAFT_400176 [Ophiobolus disseminans]